MRRLRRVNMSFPLHHRRRRSSPPDSTLEHNAVAAPGIGSARLNTARVDRWCAAGNQGSVPLCKIEVVHQIVAHVGRTHAVGHCDYHLMIAYGNYEGAASLVPNLNQPAPAVDLFPQHRASFRNTLPMRHNNLSIRREVELS
jgi:hypothetical protein